MKSKVDSNLRDRKELGLYIHIPFCVRKCDYCDFLSAQATDATIEKYFDALLTEIESYRGRTKDYVVATVFFGGGTPSAVKEGYIERVMSLLREIFSFAEQGVEISIEVNPGTISKEKLLTYYKAGINRLSFGLQSADNKELKLLGRIHTFEQFIKNFSLAREIGFDNINIDLMSALPTQTEASWEHTLNTVLSLEPEHISAYSLIIEEGTKFYDRYREGARYAGLIPDEDTDRRIYHRTKELLEAKGYIRYEISNYAKPGKECRHNSSYWTGIEYLGIGLGAASLLKGARFSNLDDIKQYMEACEKVKAVGMCFDTKKRSPELSRDNDLSKGMEDIIGIRRDYQLLTKDQQMEEFMFLGLRMCQGVSKERFHQRFGIPMDEVFGEQIEELIKKKLLETEGDILKLTEYGTDISNYVLAEFLLN